MLKKKSGGHTIGETHITDAAGGEGEGHVGVDTHVEGANILAQVRFSSRQCAFAIRQQNRSKNSLLAFIRVNCLGWSLELPEKERKRINLRAAAIVKAAVKGTKPKIAADAAWVETLHPTILAVEAARLPFDAIRLDAEKQMTGLVSPMPIWRDWASGVRGLGVISVARIIAELGNPGNYANPDKMSKRMCLAVIDGKAQGHPGKGATNEDWIRHAANKGRRAVMWVVGDCLVKQGQEYRDVYLGRKAYLRDRSPDMTKLHVHRSAQRFMEKRLLRDLWCQWRVLMAEDRAVSDA